MKEIDSHYLKRSQKDYSMSFKLSVVQEIESGCIRVSGARQKYGIQDGNFDLSNQSSSPIMKTPQQKIYELKQKLRLLERENRFL